MIEWVMTTTKRHTLANSLKARCGKKVILARYENSGWMDELIDG